MTLYSFTFFLFENHSLVFFNPASNPFLPTKIIGDIKKGIKSKNKVVTIINREKAIISGLKKLNNKSVILIAGKGHEDYQEINGEKMSFSDHNVVKKFYRK